MNNQNGKKLDKIIKSSQKIELKALEMKAKDVKGKYYKSIAFNEVSLMRQTQQAAKINIKINNIKRMDELICDGIMVSTAAGSTAYNLSVHGPVLNLNSRKLSISPISPFRPRKWKGKIVSEKSKIVINNLNVNKRPISAVADNYEVRNIKDVKVNINPSIKFKLLYDKNNSLNKKIKLEKFKKR